MGDQITVAALSPAGVVRRAREGGFALDAESLMSSEFGTVLNGTRATDSQLQALFAPYLFSHPRGSANPAAPLVAGARAKGLRFIFAESCTGGLAGALVTAVPGSSECFWGSMVTYANAAKERILGVSTLETHGAVSEATVRAMVSGALEISSTDAALAISGIAGPGGGTEQKPVGTVWFAFGFQREIRAFRARLSGDRDAVRSKAAALACCALANELGGALLDSEWIAEYTFT